MNSPARCFAVPWGVERGGPFSVHYLVAASGKTPSGNVISPLIGFCRGGAYLLVASASSHHPAEVSGWRRGILYGAARTHFFPEAHSVCDRDKNDK